MVPWSPLHAEAHFLGLKGMKLVAGLATARGLRPQHDLGILFEASVAYKDIEIAPFLEKVSDKKGELATLAYTLYCGTYAQGRRPTPVS